MKMKILSRVFIHLMSTVNSFNECHYLYSHQLQLSCFCALRNQSVSNGLSPLNQLKCYRKGDFTETVIVVESLLRTNSHEILAKKSIEGLAPPKYWIEKYIVIVTLAVEAWISTGFCSCALHCSWSFGSICVNEMI